MPKGGSGVQQGPVTVSIARGEGLVARFGEVVMYIADTSAAAAPLIAAAESVADEKYPGAAIAGRIAAIAFEHGAAQAFGVMAPTADGLLVLLRGNVVAEVDGPGGVHELSGARAVTWVDEVVPARTEPVVVRMGGTAAVTGTPMTDLRAGVVPGGGLVLERAGVRAGEHRPDPGGETTAHLQPTQQAASPTETRVSQAVSPNDTRVSQAVSPTDTRVAQAVSANPAETQASPAVAGSPPRRPPSEDAGLPAGSGVLVSEDGEVYPLDRAYVIGRDPHGDKTIKSAEASPIVILNDRHVSRVHAYISVAGDTVFIRDASTPGGTFISAPGAHDWTQIGTSPTELKPGWSIEVGNQILTYRAGTEN